MKKILSAEQLRKADQYTIEHEPISSLNLMERAVSNCLNYFDPESALYIFCGSGNNGGDGLAIARMAANEFESVQVFILANETYSKDYLENRKRLKPFREVSVKEIRSAKDFPVIKKLRVEDGRENFFFTAIIVDALFGSGLNRPLTGLGAALVDYLNRQDATRISIDIPSGLSADEFSDGMRFKADRTITFQSPKLSFFFPENYSSVGDWSVEDIQLDQNFVASLPCNNFFLEEEDVKKILRPRKKFDHKGMFGHALIQAGGEGKSGAGILCAGACATSGAGLTSLITSKDGSLDVNISYPEVMTEISNSKNEIDVTKFNACAFGPGIGIDEQSGKKFLALLKKINIPAVFDADALNILSGEKNRWKLIPKHSILTPHLKEFERLAGKTSNWFERHELQVSISKQHSLYIILKGAYTCITTPEGKSFFNSTGNPGMAKGGSGDVLTGMIVSFLAQNYSPEQACILAVYLHGLAADIAVKKTSEHSLLASDIIANIGNAFRKIEAA